MSAALVITRQSSRCGLMEGQGEQSDRQVPAAHLVHEPGNARIERQQARPEGGMTS